MSKMPERIVSCSPAISEIVCSLGLGDKLVAVTSYDDYPAEASALVAENHTIGGFYTPNFESIISYAPDLVLVNSGVPSHQSLAQQLKDAGYTVMQLYAQANLEEVYKSIELVGEISGKKAKATEVITDMENRISDIGDKVASDAYKPSVMYVSYAESGFTNVWPSGAGTAVDQIISLAGGTNVFADQNGWINPSNEVFIDRAASVDCLIITSMYSGSDAENMTAFFKADPIWKNSPAVINNTIYYLQGQGESIFNRQTVRMVDAVQLMAEILHPTIFNSTIPHDPSGVNADRGRVRELHLLGDLVAILLHGNSSDMLARLGVWGKLNGRLDGQKDTGQAAPSPSHRPLFSFLIARDLLVGRCGGYRFPIRARAPRPYHHQPWTDPLQPAGTDHLVPHGAIGGGHRRRYRALGLWSGHAGPDPEPARRSIRDRGVLGRRLGGHIVHTGRGDACERWPISPPPLRRSWERSLPSSSP